MKAVAFSVLFVVFTVQALAWRSESLGAATKSKPKDQELFLAGANAIAKGKYDQGRILLNTMIYTYTDSPLVEPAKLIVFYSFAKHGGAKNETSEKLLREIEQQYERNGWFKQKSSDQ